MSLGARLRKESAGRPEAYLDTFGATAQLEVQSLAAAAPPAAATRGRPRWSHPLAYDAQSAESCAAHRVAHPAHSESPFSFTKSENGAVSLSETTFSFPSAQECMRSLSRLLRDAVLSRDWPRAAGTRNSSAAARLMLLLGAILCFAVFLDRAST